MLTLEQINLLSQYVGLGHNTPFKKFQHELLNMVRMEYQAKTGLQMGERVRCGAEQYFPQGVYAYDYTMILLLDT